MFNLIEPENHLKITRLILFKYNLPNIYFKKKYTYIHKIMIFSTFVLILVLKCKMYLTLNLFILKRFILIDTITINKTCLINYLHTTFNKGD